MYYIGERLCIRHGRNAHYYTIVDIHEEEVLMIEHNTTVSSRFTKDYILECEFEFYIIYLRTLMHLDILIDWTSRSKPSKRCTTQYLNKSATRLRPDNTGNLVREVFCVSKQECLREHRLRYSMPTCPL